jgi:diguanylate cyclase (GGDEF)-like protein
LCKKLQPFFIFFSILAFILFPSFLILKFYPTFAAYAVLAYFFSLILFVFYHKKSNFFLRKLTLKKESLQEKIHTSQREVLKAVDLRFSLERKIKNYQRLEKFTEGLNNEISLERICDLVVNELFVLFGFKGNALLYLVNDKTRRLELRAIKKEDQAQKILEKMGDLFDQWVLRHNQPLLVESTMSDFRFDPEKVKNTYSRPLGSLMCVPLATEVNYSLGVLRVDSPSQNAYYSDDLRFLSMIADIAKLAIENAIYFAHMKEFSITDGLTEIFLRRHGVERLKEEFLRAERDANAVSFLMIDIDHFKHFNDRFGHIGGDLVLKKLAKWLKDFFDFPGSFIFRYGGEEFSVVMPYIWKAEAIKLTEGFRQYLNGKEVVFRREKTKITVSIGIAGFPGDAVTAGELIRSADDALLRAKRQGRDRACY